MPRLRTIFQSSRSKALSHLYARNLREVAGTAVLFPDWPTAPARRSDVAIVLHLDDLSRLEAYLSIVEQAALRADIVVVVPETVAVTVAPDVFEVLTADLVGDHLFQLTALVNSGRLTGYRTVVRHVDDAADALSRFEALPLDSIDSLVHADVSRAGVFVTGGSLARTSTDATYRAAQMLRLTSTRLRSSAFDVAGRSISTVALRGATLEMIRPLRIDHQDFFAKYHFIEREGQATQKSLGGTVDRHAADAVTNALLALVDASGLRIDALSQVELTDAPPAGTSRARAWAVYHPDLTTTTATRNVSWGQISATVAMYIGQHLPLAPTSYSDPLVARDRQKATADAAASGITGFLVAAQWGREGLSPAPFFESLAGDNDFPWAILLQQSLVQRINPTGVFPLKSPWKDPGVEHYAALAARVAALANGTNYLRVDGRPVVIIQDLLLLDDRVAFIANLREAFSSTGVWLATAEDIATSRPHGPTVPDELDGIVQLPPLGIPLRKRLKLGGRFGGFNGSIIDISSLAVGSQIAVRAGADENIIPGAFVGYDTTPELRSQGTVGYNWNVATFRRQLENAVRSVAWRDESRRIVIINSWNGWADMSQLEPGYHRGDSYLSAVKDTLQF